MEKLNRVLTIDTLHGSSGIHFQEPKTPTTPYLVDDSRFCPMTDAVKRLDGTRPLTDKEIEKFYDFPDGRDNGMSVPTGRSHFADITELSTDIRNQQKQVDFEIKKKKAVDKIRNNTSTVVQSV